MRIFYSFTIALWSLCSLQGIGQTILSQQSVGAQYAVYNNIDPEYLLGAFDMDFNGQSAIGGRDLFFLAETHQEIIGGFGVEEWIAIESFEDQTIGAIQFFGTLFNDNDSYTSSASTAYAFVSFNPSGSRFLGKLEGNLSISGTQKKGDHLAIAFLTSQTILYQDQIWFETTEPHIVLAEMEPSGALNLIKTVEYEGDLSINNLNIFENQWILSGNFNGDLVVNQELFSTQTSNVDGLVIQTDIEADELSFFTATGVFDVSFYDCILTDSDQYYFGEYIGEVRIGSEILQEPMLNRNVFIYSQRTSALINIGGTDEDRIQAVELIDDQLILGGYFLDDFSVLDANEDCQGEICSYLLLLNQDLVLEELIIDDSKELLLPYHYTIDGERMGFCGEYRGTIGLQESIDTDWICIYRNRTSNNQERKDRPIQLFPNPTIDRLYFNPSLSSQNWQYHIFNPYGHILQQGTIKAYINVEELPVGQYYLKLTNKDSSKVFTFNKF